MLLSGMALHELDRQLSDLRDRFPLWQIWYVPRAAGRGATWCANRLPHLEADSPAELAELMTAAERA
jgi:hypothetical protein